MWLPSLPERRRALVPSLALVALLLAGAMNISAASAGPIQAGSRRIVAIGDIHGAFDPLVSILRQTGLIDERNRWSGGDAVLVQTGDVTDRGARVVKVVELLMRLQEEAPKHGGEVVVLLGNHELLNLLGDLRDVTPEIIDDFVDERSPIRRQLLWRDHGALLKRRAKLFGHEPEKLDDVAEAAFLAKNPPGLVEYREAIGPKGRYGAWLRGLPAVARRGETIFVHGGLNETLAGVEVENINRKVHAELAAFDHARAWLLERKLILPDEGAREMVALVRDLAALEGAERPPAEVVALTEIDQWLIARSDGPFWLRDYARWSDEEGAARLPPLLAAAGVRHFVVGHTPQGSKSIKSRFEGGVFLIDTGMLESVYRGRPAALEIAGERFKAIYLGEEEVLLDPALGPCNQPCPDP